MAGNATFSTFVTSTLRNYRKKLVENILGQQALWFQLRQRGFIQEDKGGRSIVVPIMYGDNSTVSSYSGYDLLDVTPQEGISASEYDWKFIAGSVSISGEEEFKNSGDKVRIFNLLDAKIRQLELSMRKELNSQLFADGTASSKDLTGLGIAVEDGSGGTWSEYGGIDPDTTGNTFWANQVQDFDTFHGGASTFLEKVATGAGGTKGVKSMRQMYNQCTIQGSAPTLIVTTLDLYNAYEGVVEGDKQRVTDTRLADAGFENLKFKGVPMVFDSDMDDEGMLFLNSRHLKFVIGKGRNFASTPMVRPDNQDAKVSQVLFAGNLVTEKRDVQGRIVSMTE
jgi:hypothetical protein